MDSSKITMRTQASQLWSEPTSMGTCNCSVHVARLSLYARAVAVGVEPRVVVQLAAGVPRQRAEGRHVYEARAAAWRMPWCQAQEISIRPIFALYTELLHSHMCVRQAIGLGYQPSCSCQKAC